MKKMILDEYTINEFVFHGAFVVSSQNGFSLMLSKEGTSIVLSDKLINDIVNKNMDNDLKFKLVQYCFASYEGKGIINRINKTLNPVYFVLDLTNKCNFNCIYCFRDEKKNSIIDSKSLENNLNYIRDYCYKNNIDSIHIQPWGGEPLIAFDMIEKISQFFLNTNIKVKIDLETNASLVTEEIAKKLYSSHISVGISIDGTRDIHNAQRLLKNNEHTYDLVVNGINNLKKYYGNNLGCISVITNKSINKVKEIIDNFVNNLKINHFKFNIVRENDFGREKNLVPSRDSIKKFYEELFFLMLEKVNTNECFIEDTIRTRILNVLFHPKKNCCNSNGCTGGKTIISIDKNGNIFPCEMTDFEDVKIGNINDGYLIDLINNAIPKNTFFKPKKLDDCQNCPWLPYCKGGCTSRTIYQNKIGEKDEVECLVNSTLYPLICDLIINNIEVAYKLLNI